MPNPDITVINERSYWGEGDEVEWDGASYTVGPVIREGAELRRQGAKLLVRHPQGFRVLTPLEAA